MLSAFTLLVSIFVEGRTLPVRPFRVLRATRPAAASIGNHVASARRACTLSAVMTVLRPTFTRLKTPFDMRSYVLVGAQMPASFKSLTEYPILVISRSSIDSEPKGLTANGGLVAFSSIYEKGYFRSLMFPAPSGAAANLRAQISGELTKWGSSVSASN